MSSTWLGCESWPGLQSQMPQVSSKCTMCGPVPISSCAWVKVLSFTSSPPFPHWSQRAPTPQTGTGSQPAAVMQMLLSPALECGNLPGPTEGTKALRVGRGAPQ